VGDPPVDDAQKQVQKLMEMLKQRTQREQQQKLVSSPDRDKVKQTLCGAVQYSTVQYSAVQYSTVQCSTVQYNAVQEMYCRRGSSPRGSQQHGPTSAVCVQSVG
jgi:hypothetical protein